jgi:hypothetical protein
MTDGSLGPAFETVTVTEAAVVSFPATSRPIAVNVWEPAVELAVFQSVEYGATRSSAPRFAPSSLN